VFGISEIAFELSNQYVLLLFCWLFC